MVATSAFGMGIDKPDIQHIIRIGVPENICSWAQELGRAGRNGQSVVATIFYSMSDIDHGGAWVREHVHNSSYCKQILKEFSISWGIPCPILLENVEGKYYWNCLGRMLLL